MTDLVLHLLVFAVVCVALLMAPLLLGRFLRPRRPSADKDSIYECGEPTIGRSDVQFDLRFYVVALLFIVFDVELVFFFPWTLVMGSLTQLADTRWSEDERQQLTERLLTVEPGALAGSDGLSAASAVALGWTAVLELAVFFGLLVVGFAYVWRRGDLDWVRAMTRQPRAARSLPRGFPTLPAAHEPTVSATTRG